MKSYLLIISSFFIFSQVIYSQNYWQQTALTNTEVWSLASNSNGDIFAGLTFNRGIKRTTDNGVSWTQVLSLPPSPPNRWVYSIAVNNQDYIFAAVESYGGVFRSTNNGLNWTVNSFSSFNINSLATNSNGHIFAGGDGVYRSDDNGVSWTHLNLNNLGIFSLAINQKNNYLYAGTSNGSIYRSTNNGDHWDSIYSIQNSYARCLTVSPNGNVYAGCQNYLKIYRSIDNGLSWNEVLSSQNNYFISTLEFNSLNHVFAGTSNGGVYRSTNNGDLWLQINSGLNDFNVRAISIDPSGFAYAGSYAGVARSSFTTAPCIKINVTVLEEGKYNNIFNLLSQRDTMKVLLRNSVAPFNIIDSSKGVIDSNNFSQIFSFCNTETGNYYISVRNNQCIDTWSKDGGELLTNEITPYSYDFTSSISQAFDNNLKLKGSKYCLFSGDVDQDGYINLSDVIPISNDASTFLAGYYLVSDLTGDNIVDLTDISLCYNNASNFVGVIRP